MRTLRLMAAVLAVGVLAGCGGGDAADTAPSWNHDPGDSTLGPSGWGEIDEAFEQCLTGTGQSPIDIATTVPADLPALELGYGTHPLVVENTGHVIEVPVPEESEDTLTVGGDEYRLVQYHFHAPERAHARREQYDVEAHFVHEDAGGMLAVVGVFLDEGGTPSLLLDSVTSRAPEEAGEEAKVEEEWSPAELLPGGGADTTISRYYTYEGSLTTPGCTEGVRWIVLKDTGGISPSATKRLHELISDFPAYDGYENNNRPTQPLNDRQVESSEDR